jgi:hypothetical protein
MTNETLVTVKDLRYIELECAQCHTKVILDMQNPPQPAKDQGYFSFEKCPACPAEYGGTIRGAINAIQRAFESLLSTAPHLVRFRISDTRDPL